MSTTDGTISHDFARTEHDRPETTEQPKWPAVFGVVLGKDHQSGRFDWGHEDIAFTLGYDRIAR
jgi:hypothetical protein